MSQSVLSLVGYVTSVQANITPLSVAMWGSGTSQTFETFFPFSPFYLSGEMCIIVANTLKPCKFDPLYLEIRIIQSPAKCPCKSVALEARLFGCLRAGIARMGSQGSTVSRCTVHCFPRRSDMRTTACVLLMSGSSPSIGQDSPATLWSLATSPQRQ